MTQIDETGSAFAVEHILTLCGATGSCPSVYRTSRGTYLIQGYVVSTGQDGEEVPAGQQRVEIPRDLLSSAVLKRS